MAHNIADLFEHAVDAVPENPALKVADRVVTFAELEADANRLAHHLQAQGVGPGDHVAIYAKNSVEHVVALLAVTKIRAVSINVNYRYVESELDYLFDNADVVAVIHERTYAPLVAACFAKHEQLRHAVVVPDALAPDDDSDVSSYGGVLWTDALAARSPERDFGERSADDLHIIYTGGTTGFPKGVMWRHEDFWRVLGGGIDFYTGVPLDEFDQSKQAVEPRMMTFPLSPLMHGGAQASLLMHLFAGHCTILEPKFDAQRTWEIAEREKIQMLFMTGDAMALPLIDEFERKAGEGTPYDASNLFVISSSAAVFSPQVKRRWMNAFPDGIFTDSVGASETGFQGMGMQDKEHISTDGPVIGLGPNSVVIDDDNRVTLLGRGSNCVNTGGEKVYPEEVEMAVKAHPAVYDCLVVGVPDEKYGQAVAAVVELREGASLELDALRDFL
ncbi:MAG: AMP-binding protein, partial [Nocardioides sp.]